MAKSCHYCQIKITLINVIVSDIKTYEQHCHALSLTNDRSKYE